MTRLRRIWDAWCRFWFREVDGTPLALVRIAFTVPALYWWFGTTPVLRRYYSDAGEFPIVAARAWGHELWYRLAMPDMLGGFPVVLFLFLVLFLALGCLMVGWRTRWAAGATWVLLTWFQYRNPTFLNGGDEVMRLTAFYLALAYVAVPPRNRALSLDRRRVVEAGDGRARVPVWTLRLIQIQVCLMYLVSGFWKVVDPDWRDGSAIYYALGSDTFGRFGLPDWAWLGPLFAAVTLTVAWWEFLFPLLVGWARSRIPALLFGVAFHLAILVTMNIGPFPLAVLATYPAFLDPDRTGRWGRGVLREAPGFVRRLWDSPREAPAGAS